MPDEGIEEGGLESGCSGEKRPPRCPDFFSFFTISTLLLTLPDDKVFSEERLFESDSFLTGL